MSAQVSILAGAGVLIAGTATWLLRRTGRVLRRSQSAMRAIADRRPGLPMNGGWRNPWVHGDDRDPLLALLIVVIVCTAVAVAVFLLGS